MKSSVLLLLWLGSPVVLARDPFQPVTPALCQSVMAPLEGWRLQGIIGVPHHYVAWLRSPEGKSIRLTEQMLLPLTSWRVQQLTARALLLQPEQSCSPQQMRWQIKGGFYATD